MRIQYFFTSDLEEVPEKVKLQLEYFLNKISIDSELQNSIKNLEKTPLNYSTFFSEVDNIRTHISKLDLLLKEAKEILVVCQKAELGEYSQGEPEKQRELKKETLQEQPPAKSELTELKSAMSQVNQMTSALKQFKRNSNV